MSARALVVFARTRPDSVYWAGLQRGTALELTEAIAGRVYVRYLRHGARAGSSRADFLTIGTYPGSDAFAQVQAATRRPGAVTISIPGGGLAVYNRASPTSVFLAYPTGREQVEIYDPRPGESRLLVEKGWVRPIVAPTPAAVASAPRAVSWLELTSVARSSEGGLYSAGSRSHGVYELTEAGDGRTFVRYLTNARDVGSRLPAFLTVGTYPDAQAFPHVQMAAKRQGAVTISLPDGGLAVYDRARPTSVYLAYPGGTAQVEVYSPSAAEARRLVEQGQIRPVG